MINQIKHSAEFLKQSGVLKPEIAIILGTGLGNLATHIKVIKEINYADIPNFPLSTVESHSGKLIYGTIHGKSVIAMKGRFHFYEGYDMNQITFPVRVLKQLGVNYLLISNASGGINTSYKKGDLMLVDDHINLQVSNPLIGRNFDELGPRFPDMSSPYDLNLNQLLTNIANEKSIKLHKGVYVSVTGPNLETRAEYRFLKIIGADAVGMSTVPEVIVANHMKLPCCAISVITDECDPENLKPVSIKEIIEVASKAEMKLTELYLELIKIL